MLVKKIIMGLVLLATAMTSRRPALLPPHLVALTSNVTAAPHRLQMHARQLVNGWTRCRPSNATAQLRCFCTVVMKARWTIYRPITNRRFKDHFHWRTTP
jgi:hypothetical protein